MSKKRRREPSSIDTQMVEIYDDLANENEEVRFKAAHALLSKFSPENDASHEELVEVVRRLIRGLCSGRKAARVGFSIALTELLSQSWGRPHNDTVEDLTIADLIDILEKQTEVTGKVSGQEERDHQFGRLFGVEAFIKSGVLFQHGLSTTSWSAILDIVFEAAKKKSWLREECGWILYGACSSLGNRDRDLDLRQMLIDRLCQNGLAMTPEGVAVWLKIQTEVPGVHLPGNVWRDENPLHRKEKSRLAKILKETSSEADAERSNGEVAQKGNWTSKLHFVWSAIFTILVNAEPTSLEISKTVTFDEFWQEAVDEHLFAPSASDERKYWGLLLFQQVFSSASTLRLPALFTRKFIRCLANQLASNERYLNRAAEKTIKTIFNRVEWDPSAAYAPLTGLSGTAPDGALSFDQLSKTKTVDRLIALADDSSLWSMAPQLCSKLLRPGRRDEKAATATRQVLADQLLSLVKSRQSRVNTQEHQVSADLNCIIDSVLKVFVKCSYFSTGTFASDRSDLPDPPISPGTQDMLRMRLSSCLSLIMSKFSRPAVYAYGAVYDIHLYESDKSLYSTLDLNGPMGQKMADAWKNVERVYRKAQKDPDKRSFLEAFVLLYSLTILQVYNGDADAVSMLDELTGCYDALITHRKKGDQHSSEALIEILLGFVAKPSQLYRRLAQQVFMTFASDVNSDGLQSMFKVLESKENLAGQDEMFEEDHQDPDSSDVMSGADSDVEEVETADANGVHASSTSDEGSEEIDDSEGKEEEDEELAVFDMKLAQALGTRRPKADLDAANEEDSSDEYMDDEQMEALDEHIATIFKERKNVTSKKTLKKDAKQTIVNFKCRVLELLEIYIKQQHRNPLALNLLVPLLTVTRTTTSSLVSHKACNLMREFSKACKGKDLSEIHATNTVLKLLEAVHTEAMEDSSKAHASACSQASMLLVKVLVANDRGNLRLALDIYANTQMALWLDPKCKMKTSFFTDWLNWFTTARSAG